MSTQSRACTYISLSLVPCDTCRSSSSDNCAHTGFTLVKMWCWRERLSWVAVSNYPIQVIESALTTQSPLTHPTTYSSKDTLPETKVSAFENGNEMKKKKKSPYTSTTHTWRPRGGRFDVNVCRHSSSCQWEEQLEAGTTSRSIRTMISTQKQCREVLTSITTLDDIKKGIPRGI